MSDPASINSKRHVLDELARTRDGARLKLHLLSAEARERWQELEDGFESLEHRIDQGEDAVADVVLGRLRELTGGVGRFLERHAHHAPELDVPVREIMTKHVEICAPDEPLTNAARVMWEADCGVVPVLGADGRLAGIVTDRDLCMAAYTRGISFTWATVGSVMSKHVYTCSPDDSLEIALELMSAHKVRRLPVVTEQEHLLGIVALADIARYVRSLEGASDDARTLFTRAVAAISTPRKALARAHAAE